MKAKIEDQNKKFKPTDITITIENLDELKYFWNILYPEPSDMVKMMHALPSKYIQSLHDIECDYLDSYRVWNVIDDLLKGYINE